MAALAAVVSVAGSSAARPLTPTPGAAPATATRASSAACAQPFPTSAAGYAALWATLPTDQWGAGDVSISVPLRDGRVLWLYGDTMSTGGRFVHSSAIVQTRGCLRVANGGAQILRDDSPTEIYWIHDATQRSNGTVAIRARLVRLTGTGTWAFEDGGAWRTTIVRVTAAGDLVPLWRSPLRIAPAPDPGPLYHLSDRPGHFGYARSTHPWARLASGKTLTTTCQNYDDGVLHPLVEYRPIFTES
ncbi:hypothetical protein KMZ30_07205 [Phycicoccus sp. KQZ13P-1]|uniref:hypothetical protein n=1 Tax=Phycicoccus mangrovi TaxID=2840470 RepID=UPI001C004D5C|nr:hypothetical protein [Phycicoccus mangrovi]MBT9255358.1 hypothetical protein [Phycicoccus mangrovi]